MNDYPKAFRAQSHLLELSDSIFSHNLAQQVATMQTKYETEKKEKEIEIQKLKIKKQSLRFYLLFGFVVFAATISLFIFGRFRLKQKHARTRLEKQKLETEKRLLRSQMNPHFIFNSMNSIQSYISGNDTFKAMTYLSKFAQLMRNILENSRQSLISLSEEINTLQLYIELEQIRFDNKFDFRLIVQQNLPVEIIYVPPMMIQPFVENAIKHGLQHKKENGLLQIEFSIHGKTVRCVVTDNGIGRKISAVRKPENDGHHSLGIQVTKERFDAIKKQKGVDVNFEIIDLTDDSGDAAGTRVIINLPFETEE
jgi:LytS/YehU family sensor histidine kinase